jgi:hypothetical protein
VIPAAPRRGRPSAPVRAPTIRALARLGLALAWLLLVAAPAPGAESGEYQVKAAFLINFVRFAEWPDTAFAGDESPITIGILGEDPFGTTLDDTLRDQTVRKRRLVVRRALQIGGLDGCQVVFIARSESGHLAGILDALSRRPVLTVSDLDGFAAAGGMIGFVLDNSKVRFEIDPAAAQRQQLRLDAQLIRLGHVVGAPVDAGKGVAP